MGHHIPLVRGGRGQCQGRARAREVPCRPHAPRLEKPERGDTREAGAGARAPLGLQQLQEKAPGGMKRQADKENPGGIISLRGLLSSSRKLPRSTKASCGGLLHALPHRSWRNAEHCKYLSCPHPALPHGPRGREGHGQNAFEASERNLADFMNRKASS